MQRTTRPAPLSFRENRDLGANQTGSHTNAVGRKSCFPALPTDRKMPRPDKKGKQSFYTKIQAGESGEKGKQSFCTKETAPPNPYSLEKTGARDEQYKCPCCIVAALVSEAAFEAAYELAINRVMLCCV